MELDHIRNSWPQCEALRIRRRLTMREASGRTRNMDPDLQCLDTFLYRGLIFPTVLSEHDIIGEECQTAAVLQPSICMSPQGCRAMRRVGVVAPLAFSLANDLLLAQRQPCNLTPSAELSFHDASAEKDQSAILCLLLYSHSRDGGPAAEHHGHTTIQFVAARVPRMPS